MINDVSWGRFVICSRWILLCLLFALTACDSAPVGPNAEQIGQLFYEAVKKGDFATAASYFVESAPRDQLVQELKSYQEKLGDLEVYNLKDTVTNTVFSGRRFILKYKNRYTKHHTTEGLILFQPVTDNIIRIEIRNVQSRTL